MEDIHEEWYYVVTVKVKKRASILYYYFAAACLKFLNDETANRLKEAMSNPANFGIAKSFVMMGRDSGFDMSTEEGVRSWMEIYNAGIAKGTQPRIPLPGEQSKSASNIRDSIKILRSNRERMAKTSRKKNRKKK